MARGGDPQRESGVREERACPGDIHRVSPVGRDVAAVRGHPLDTGVGDRGDPQSDPLLRRLLLPQCDGDIEAGVDGDPVSEHDSLPEFAGLDPTQRDLRLVRRYPEGREEACEPQLLAQGEEAPPQVLRGLQELEHPLDEARLPPPARVVEDVYLVDAE